MNKKCRKYVEGYTLLAGEVKALASKVFDEDRSRGCGREIKTEKEKKGIVKL